MTGAVEQFVESVTDALDKCGADQTTVESVETAGEQLAEHVEQLRGENEDLREENEQFHERVRELEQRPRIEWEDAPEPGNIRIVDGETSGVWDVSEAVRLSAPSHVADTLEEWIVELEEKIESQDDDGVEADVDESTPTPDGADQRTQAPVTPLGDCVTLPEPVADAELTANIKRARDVAADVIDYGRSVPAGYAITSSELRTVLTAMSEGDGKAYTETVRRVMNYLDELGSGAVTLKETMGGQQTVIFDDEFVRRTVAWRQSAGNDVVAGDKTTG